VATGDHAVDRLVGTVTVAPTTTSHAVIASNQLVGESLTLPDVKLNKSEIGAERMGGAHGM
jgi:hypothetical protein